MTVGEILVALNDVFRETFDDDSITVNAATTAKDVDGWDSLAHIRLVVTAEQKFGVRFSAAQIADLKNVGDFAQLIHDVGFKRAAGAEL